jgi:hypothetical protein
MADKYVFGTGFFGLLFIAFLVLKLCHVIDWSWWWIFAPLYLPALFAIFFFIGAFMVMYFIKKLNR